MTGLPPFSRKKFKTIMLDSDFVLIEFTISLYSASFWCFGYALICLEGVKESNATNWQDVKRPIKLIY